MSLAEKIYKVRTQKNMSQLDLADALEVSRQSVSKWETGAAVPELEKIVKMSDLFGVTLDELVGRAPPSPTAPVPPAVSWLSAIPPRKIVGTVLLACAFLTFLVLAVTEDATAGLLWAIPFALCGITCFVFKRHVGVWCAWALYLPFSFIPIDQVMHPDFSLIIRLFVQLPILVYTVMSFHRESLELTNRVKTFLGVGYSAWFIYFAMWLGSLNAPPELFEGFRVDYLLEALIFPLFTALLTITIRVWKSNSI